MTPKERKGWILKTAERLQPAVNDRARAISTESVTKGFTTFQDEEGILVFVKRKVPPETTLKKYKEAFSF